MWVRNLSALADLDYEVAIDYLDHHLAEVTNQCLLRVTRTLTFANPRAVRKTLEAQGLA